MNAPRLPFMISYLLCAPVLMLVGQEPLGHPYYPLSVGNSWRYKVHVEKLQDRESKVVWRVTKANRTKSGRIIYQVWPTPMQADDEAMQLAISEAGVEEISSGKLILKAPLRLGDHWDNQIRGLKGRPASSLKVLSLGHPCSIASKQFPNCAVIEEIDPILQMRTITKYAKGVGPIEYKYFKIEQNGKQTELQTVRLDSYKVLFER